MKKIIFLLLITAQLTSCKNEGSTSTTETAVDSINGEENRASTPDSIPQTDDCPTKIYYGIGKFNKKSGAAVYTASLPRDSNPATYVFKQFRVANNVVFIHLDNNTEDELSNSTCNEYKINLTIPEYKESENIESFTVFLWHDKGAMTKLKAIEEYEKYLEDSKKDSLPKKFGHGVLSVE